MNPVCENRIDLVGTLLDEMQTVTDYGGRVMHHGVVAVERQSGTVDYLPVRSKDKAVFDLRGKKVAITGELVSFMREQTVNRQYTGINVRGIRETDCHDKQQLVLEGTICKEPVFRVVKTGRNVCELVIAVTKHRWCSYIHVVAWGMNAMEMSEKKVGDVVTLTGRFQSRKYIKPLENGECEVRTAYEVSAKDISVIGHQREWRAV